MVAPESSRARQLFAFALNDEGAVAQLLSYAGVVSESAGCAIDVELGVASCGATVAHARVDECFALLMKHFASSI